MHGSPFKRLPHNDVFFIQSDAVLSYPRLAVYQPCKHSILISYPESLEDLLLICALKHKQKHCTCAGYE